MSQLPDWLSSGGLDFFQQELWSDLELFFESGSRWLIQIKNHTLELAEFRDVLTDFQRRHRQSNGQYEKYIIVSTAIAKSVQEIWNTLERWRAVNHLDEAELVSTKAGFISKLREHSFSDLTDFLFENAEKIQIDGAAGWVKDENLIRRMFISKLVTSYSISHPNAENFYLSIAEQLVTERGQRVELSPLRNDLDKFIQPPNPPACPPPFILPQLDISTFTGRIQELNKLEELILKTEGGKVCSIAGLSGTGGVGKSALACHFAQLHKDAFPDGVIGIRVDGKDNDTIAREFARLCGEEIQLEDERSATTIMQEAFGHRRMLLIFDNAEDASIQALRPGGNTCAVIITTRDRQLPFLLDIPLEGRVDLPPLLYPDAVLLLKQLVGSERVTAELQSINAIIELVGSLPLALQIVGATLQVQENRSLESYEYSLREEKERLQKLKVRGAAHLDVRASFSLSLKLLKPEELDFFACLSVCAQDGFSVQGAMAAGNCDEATTHERLGYLYRLSLLNRIQSSTNRFVFHPLIRLFAQELSVEHALKVDATERHARFFTELVKFSDVNDQQVVSVLSEELEDIILAAGWLQQQETTDYSFVISLQPFLQRYGYWLHASNLMTGFLSVAERKEDWRAVVQLRIQQAKYLSLRGDWPEAEKALVPIAAAIDKIDIEEVRARCEAMWLNTLGGLQQRQGRFEEAAETFQRSAAIDEHLGDLRGQAKVLNSLGGVLQRQGNFEAAAKVFRRSAEIEATIENTHGQAMVLNSLGSVLQRQGLFDEAANSFRQSYELLMKLGDRRGQAMALNSLGGILQRQGFFNEAVEALNHSNKIEEQIGNKLGQAKVLNSLGGVLQRQGRFDEAIDAFQRSYAISENLNDIRSLAMVLNSLGGVLQRQGRFDEAVDAFQRSYVISEKLEDQRSLAMVLNSLGGVFQRQGRFDEAVDAFQRSYSISENLNDDHSLAMVLNSLGGVLQRQGRFDEAVDAFQRSYVISEKLEDQRSLAMVLNSLGGVLQRQGRFDEAIDAFQRSYAISENLNDIRSLAMVLNSLGGVLQRQGRFDEAVDAFQRSYDLLIKLGDPRGQAMLLNSLGGVLQRQGRFDEAVDAFQRSYVISEKLEDQRSLAMVLNSLGGVLQRQGRFDEAVDAFNRSAAIEEEIGNRRGQAMVLNSLGGVLQRQGRFDEAVDAFQRSYAISENLNDDRSLAMILNSLGGVLQRQGRFDEAVDAFQRSYVISEELGDQRSLGMVLNSLGGVFQRQGRFDEAIKAFERSYNILFANKDKRGQAMVLNSLGGVLERKGDIVQAIDAFNRSLKLGEELNDKRHLAMVHTSIGKTFLFHGEIEKSINELSQGFEFEEYIKSRRGVEIVTPLLLQALIKTGRNDEALGYYRRALLIAPDSTRLLKLKDRFSEAHGQSNKDVVNQGSIKRIIRHQNGYRYGFIVPDTSKEDIYFNERDVDPTCLSSLKEGARVEFDVTLGTKGQQAKNIRLI
ncbi:MAG TPA: tetratricopeptide repeat protein [Pyrinomonadaceae bacterium]|nr:tetratricopeptide repeat protein [Pyrinomonadaceae bacterium]